MRRLLAAANLLLCFLIAGCGNPGPPTGTPVARPSAEKVVAAKTNTANLPESKQPAVGPKSRKFTFHYRFRVKDLTPSGDAEKDLVRVWLPCPSSTDCQEVARLAASTPAELSEQQETRYSNRLLYLETPIPAAGGFSIDIPYEVVRHEVLQNRLVKTRNNSTQSSADRLLAADKLVPTSGKPLTMLDMLKLEKEPLALARQLYDVVDEHVVYKKEGTGWGRGDTNWVCESGYGNCTDFHSLFISLARSQGLPSRFEIGFSIPTDKTEGPIAGYHCWAWFYLQDRGWIPVDISEADKHPELKDYYFGNLTADRVMFSTGRDLELVPKSAHEPLNFHIYPYIEFGDQPLPKENVELQFTFADK